jgi:hypothetical protein
VGSSDDKNKGNKSYDKVSLQVIKVLHQKLVHLFFTTMHLYFPLFYQKLLAAIITEIDEVAGTVLRKSF